MTTSVKTNGRRRNTSFVVAAMIVAGLGFSPLSAEAQLKTLLKNLSGDSDKSKAKKDTGSPKSTKVKNDGKIGEEPIALVEKIRNAPNAKVDVMDTVFKNQLIILGRRGKLHLSFVESCHEEIITGGRVTVAADPRTGGNRVAGGRMRTKSKSCAAQNTKIAALKSDAREFGTNSERARKDNPYDLKTWREKTISIRRPMFVWNRRGSGRVRIEVLFLDNPGGPKVIWKSRTKRNYIRYSRAPRLRTGYPYQFRVSHGDGTTSSGFFSYDPNYERRKTLAANTVIAGR